MKNFLMVASFVLLTACATPQPPIQTASGQPEITLHAVSAKCVSNGFMNMFIDHGYTVKSSTDTQIVAEKETTNTAAAIFFSTEFSGTPYERVRLMLVPRSGNNLRLVISEQYVSNPNTAFEHVHPITHSQTDQEKFQAAAPKIQAKCGVKAKAKAPPTTK